MDHPVGRILSIVQAADGGRLAIVDVDAALACERCASGKGCGAGVFGSRQSRQVEAELPDRIVVQEGDYVAIHLSANELLPAAIIVYGWPLAGAAAGALLGSLGPGTSDAAASVGALVGLLAGAWLARRKLKSGDCLARFRPVVLQPADVARGVPVAGP